MEQYRKKRRRRRRKKHIFGKILLGLFLVLAVLVLAAGGFYLSLLNRLDFAERSSLYAATDAEWAARIAGMDPIESEDVEAITSENQAVGQVRREKDVINVLLIGSDQRIPNTDDPGRADVTMLCSLNKKTGEVKLISFERGIMVELPGGRWDLLTHSFHYGGANLTTNILRRDFLLDITGYAHVDFDAFSAIVDTVGGVDVTLTAEESAVLGLGGAAGLTHLDGPHALRYCRLRSIDSNWQRIARQRTTIQAIMNKVKDMNITELTDLAKVILPMVNTDLTRGEITSLVLSAPKFLGTTAGQMTVPDNFDQHCNFQYETDRIRTFIYGN